MAAGEEQEKRAERVRRQKEHKAQTKLTAAGRRELIRYFQEFDKDPKCFEIHCHDTFAKNEMIASKPPGTRFYGSDLEPFTQVRDANEYLEEDVENALLHVHLIFKTRADRVPTDLTLDKIIEFIKALPGGQDYQFYPRMYIEADLYHSFYTDGDGVKWYEFDMHL